MKLECWESLLINPLVVITAQLGPLNWRTETHKTICTVQTVERGISNRYFNIKKCRRANNIVGVSYKEEWKRTGIRFMLEPSDPDGNLSVVFYGCNKIIGVELWKNEWIIGWIAVNSVTSTLFTKLFKLIITILSREPNHKKLWQKERSFQWNDPIVNTEMKPTSSSIRML